MFLLKKLSPLWMSLSAASLLGISMHVASIPTDNWVYALHKDRGDTTLRELVIPGTHDSATHNMGSSSDISPDSPGIYIAAKGVVADWGRTQSYDIEQMLEKGIRHVDLRILKHKGEFVNVHGLVGMPVDEVLRQVQSFASAHPYEPIILEVAKTPSAEDMPDLVALFDHYLGLRKPDTDKPLAQITLSELWADDLDGQNNNVIVIWASGSSFGVDAGYFGADQLPGTWADTEQSTALKHRLFHGWNRDGRVYKGLNGAPVDTLFYSAFTFTPKDNTIIEDVLNIFSSGSLLDWSRDWMRGYLGAWVEEWHAEGYRPNIMTADFFEYTAMVPMAIRLNTVAPDVPEIPLAYILTNHVDRVWDDKGSGADHDGSVWRLRSQQGYFPLGDMPHNGYGYDWSLTRMLVKEDQPGVVKPLGYNWIWNDRDSGADKDASVWRPIAPQGFVCLGDVVTTNHGLAPSTDLIRCVHESYVGTGSLMAWKWNDKGSGGKYDLSMWMANGDSSVFHALGLMRSVRSHSSPDSKIFGQLIKAKTVELANP